MKDSIGRSRQHKTKQLLGSSCKALGILLLCAFVACSSSKGKRGSGAYDMSEGDLAGDREGRFGENSIPSAEGEGYFRDIHFEYDSSSLDESARGDLEYNAQLLQQYDKIKVVLEGHTDERGTEEYNLQLGQARARAVQSHLSSLGISSSRLEVISYGENLPLERGSYESAWSKNRRVHFSPTESQPKS
jgi:peptidoglycan-associated lipoprotein